MERFYPTQILLTGLLGGKHPLKVQESPGVDVKSILVFYKLTGGDRLKIEFLVYVPDEEGREDE